jgi:hypothetical protein
MSLYKDASLVMLPSAVKDGKLYSIRPTDGSGDFTFSRGSNLAATRVDVNGLIEKGRENLILHSADWTNSAWNKTNVSVSANATTNPIDGNITADSILETTGNGQHNFFQLIGSYSGGETITISFYAKANGRTKLRMNDGSSALTAVFDLSAETAVMANGSGIPTITSVGNDWYRCSLFFVSNGSSEYIAMNFRDDLDQDTYVGDVTQGMYFFGAQAESSMVATDYIETGASTAQAGILEDLPRLDYSGGASCPSLLLEPLRTNGNAHSEYFSGTGFGIVAATATANAATSPEGLNNATSLIGTASSAEHIIYTTGSSAYNGDVTISIFAKANGYDYFVLGAGAQSLNKPVLFNLADGTKVGNFTGWSSYSAPIDSDIEDYGDGWYRLSVTFAASSGVNTNMFFGSMPTDSVASGANVSTQNGTDGSYIYGAQIEAGSYPTSYIPTYGSAVTRSVDALSITDIQTNNLIGSNQGSFVFHYKPYNAYTGSAGEIYDFRIDANNRMATYFSNGTLRLFSNIAGATNFNQGTTLDGDTEFKIGVGFDADSTLVYINGVLTYTLNGFDLALTDFDISPPTNGSKVSSFSWFSTKLTASELAALTTL